MSDQSKLGLGQIITTPQERDAIHIAVAPVKAKERIYPGQSVRLLDGVAVLCNDSERIGVADPFLLEPAQAGQEFWLYLTPGSITSLRHDWTHPAFTKQEAAPITDKAYSERWLREYAASHYDYTPEGERYDKMMKQIHCGEITYEGTNMHSLADLDDADELRRHASVILGYEVKWGEFEYFSCTC